jgi:hypothetical protein
MNGIYNQNQNPNQYINGLLNQAFGGAMPNQQQMQQQMQLFQEFSASPEGIQAQTELNDKFTKWYNAKYVQTPVLQPTAPVAEDNSKIDKLEEQISGLALMIEGLAKEKTNNSNKKGDK